MEDIVKRGQYMREFLTLMGELFLITILQNVAVFFNAEKSSYMKELINIACYLGAMYLILQFAYENIFGQIMNMFSF